MHPLLNQPVAIAFLSASLGWAGAWLQDRTLRAETDARQSVRIEQLERQMQQTVTRQEFQIFASQAMQMLTEIKTDLRAKEDRR